MADSSLVQSLSNAIAQFEGYNVPGSVAQRNNNPGNLRVGPRAIGKDSNGYAIYATAADGFADLNGQVSTNIDRGLSLQTFIGGVPGGYPGYAPSSDNNNVQNYVIFLSNKLGIPSDVALNGLSPGSFRQVPPPHPPATERT